MIVPNRRANLNNYFDASETTPLFYHIFYMCRHLLIKYLTIPVLIYKFAYENLYT